MDGMGENRFTRLTLSALFPVAVSPGRPGRPLAVDGALARHARRRLPPLALARLAAELRLAADAPAKRGG